MPCASDGSRRRSPRTTTADRDRRLRRSRRNHAPSTADAARAIWDQLRAVRDGEVGEFEIERAEGILESQFVRRLEDMEGQANYLAEWEALGDWRMGERYLERCSRQRAINSRRSRIDMSIRTTRVS